MMTWFLKIINVVVCVIVTSLLLSTSGDLYLSLALSVFCVQISVNISKLHVIQVIFAIFMSILTINNRISDEIIAVYINLYSPIKLDSNTPAQKNAEK